MSQRITAAVHCRHCQWSARCSGDSILEVATFLRSRLMDHGAAAHPEALRETEEAPVIPVSDERVNQ